MSASLSSGSDDGGQVGESTFARVRWLLGRRGVFAWRAASATAEVVLTRLWLYRQPRPPADADLHGKTFLVTGATSGIGVDTAHALALCGARVIMAVRNVERARKLASSWGKLPSDPEAVRMDLKDLASVRSMVEELSTAGVRLDGLVLNAGIFHMGWYERQETADGNEEHLQVNFLAHFLLVACALPLLNQGARIVNVASHMHTMTVGPLAFDDLSAIQFSSCENTTGPAGEGDGNRDKGRRYDPALAYSQSKLLSIAAYAHLAALLPAHLNIHVVSLCPGNVVTDIARGTHRAIQWLYKNAVSHMFMTSEEGSWCTLTACCAPESALFGPSGGARRHAYLSYGRPVSPSPEASDPKIGLESFSVACRLVNVDPCFPLQEQAKAAAGGAAGGR